MRFKAPSSARPASLWTRLPLLALLRRELFTVTMSLGGSAWLVGNILWLCDWPFTRVVPWWMAFLGLTIVGERLDLSRFQRQETAARPLFLAALALFLGGVVLSVFIQVWGQRPCSTAWRSRSSSRTQ